MLKAFRISSVGAFSALQTGLISATFSGIGPLYGSAIGLDQHAIVLLMASMQLGGVLLQWPLGYASDHCDRRVMVLAMHIVMIALSMALVMVDRRIGWIGLATMLGAFAGIAESFYPIGVAHANDRADPSEYVSLSSNLLLVWGIGSAAGPLIATRTMQKLGPSGFFWYAAVLSALLAIQVAWRIRRAAKISEGEREKFINYPTTSPEIMELVSFRKLKRSPEALP